MKVWALFTFQPFSSQHFSFLSLVAKKKCFLFLNNCFGHRSQVGLPTLVMILFLRFRIFWNFEKEYIQYTLNVVKDHIWGGFIFIPKRKGWIQAREVLWFFPQTKRFLRRLWFDQNQTTNNLLKEIQDAIKLIFLSNMYSNSRNGATPSFSINVQHLPHKFGLFSGFQRCQRLKHRREYLPKTHKIAFTGKVTEPVASWRYTSVVFR